MGGKGSGRPSLPLTATQTRLALQKLTRSSVAVIANALSDGNVDTAWRVLEHVIGKPTQRTETASLEIFVPDALKVLSADELRAILSRHREPDALPSANGHAVAIEGEFTDATEEG